MMTNSPFAIWIGLILGLVMLILMNTSYGGENMTTIINEDTSLTKKLKVVATVAPITNIVKNIGGDKIDLIGIIPEGVDSHTFELVPTDVVKLNDADLITIDGLHLEGEIEKIAEQAQKTKPQLQLLRLGENTITEDQWIYDFSFPKEKVSKSVKEYYIISFIYS